MEKKGRATDTGEKNARPDMLSVRFVLFVPSGRDRV